MFYSVTYFGKMAFSFSSSCPLSFITLNFTPFGGYLNGLLPKLKRLCWNVIKLAAAKNSDLQLFNYHLICIFYV